MKCTNPVRAKAVVTLESAMRPLQGDSPFVPCGRCMACRLNRARTWALRIMHETRSHDVSSFVTLTYDDEHLPKNGSLVKEDVQNFFKRLRKNLGHEVKYFVGGEYGDIGHRPHYHAVIFGLSRLEARIVEKSWGLGYVHIGDVTFDSACYVASYTVKKLSGPRAIEYAQRGVVPEFALMSRRPGIGSRYCETNERFLKDNKFCVVKGNKVALPRYYAERIFSDEEKEKNRVERKEVYAEKFEQTRLKAGVVQDYQVADYQRTQREQVSADLESRQGLKRRKL